MALSSSTGAVRLDPRRLFTSTARDGSRVAWVNLTKKRIEVGDIGLVVEGALLDSQSQQASLTQTDMADVLRALAGARVIRSLKRAKGRLVIYVPDDLQAAFTKATGPWQLQVKPTLFCWCARGPKFWIDVRALQSLGSSRI
ncbi:MAG: hypothetical protein U0136_19105 [Bdellovibrionota bacterium]